MRDKLLFISFFLMIASFAAAKGSPYGPPVKPMFDYKKPQGWKLSLSGHI